MRLQIRANCRDKDVIGPQFTAGTRWGICKDLFGITLQKTMIHIFEGYVIEREIGWGVATEIFWISVHNIPQPLHLPRAVEAGEAGLAGEELLHGGLFEVALLGDEPVQRGQQPIHIAQRLCDGALFGERWNRINEIDSITYVELFLRSTVLDMLHLASAVLRIHHVAQPVRVKRWMLPDNHH